MTLNNKFPVVKEEDMSDRDIQRVIRRDHGRGGDGQPLQ